MNAYAFSEVMNGILPIFPFAKAAIFLLATLLAYYVLPKCCRNYVLSANALDLS